MPYMNNDRQSRHGVVHLINCLDHGQSAHVSKSSMVVYTNVAKLETVRCGSLYGKYYYNIDGSSTTKLKKILDNWFPSICLKSVVDEPFR